MAEEGTRVRLPGRRSSWTIKAKFEGQTVYLTVGEWTDGWPGEIWLEASKQGTFTRGVLGALARVLSVSLQCGTPLAELIEALRGLDFPPQGAVQGGSGSVTHVASLVDWLARELEVAYPSLVKERRSRGFPRIEC